MERIEQTDAVAEVVGKRNVHLSLFKHHIYHLDIRRVVGALVMKDIADKGIKKLFVRNGKHRFKHKSGPLEIGGCGGNNKPFDIAVDRSNVILLIFAVLGNYNKTVLKVKVAHRLHRICSGRLEKRTALVRRKLEAAEDAPAPECVMLSAIHTHTAPYLSDSAMSYFWGRDFEICPDPAKETLPADYSEAISSVIAEGIVKAWRERRPVSVATGFDHISIAYNRRTRYADGHTEMYGSTARPDFMEIEGTVDNGIHFIILKDDEEKTVAAVIEAACPSQVMEHHDFICSDYWDVVRHKVADKMGEFPLVSLCGAAGDLSPRDLVRTAMDEPLMHSTEMYNAPGMERVASRICETFFRFADSAAFDADADLRHDVHFSHLPLRRVTEEEAHRASEEYDALRAKYKTIDEFTEGECTELSRLAATRNRLAYQNTTFTHPVEIHALKLGGTSIVTDPFELFVAYADRIRAGSGNPNTMVVQLTNGYEGYLPTAKAISCGGYSAGVNNGYLGAEGGDALVRESLEMLKNI